MPAVVRQAGADDIAREPLDPGAAGPSQPDARPLVDVVRQPDGLPVTTVARTLVDLADVLTPHQLERACHEAEFLRRLDAGAVEHLLRRLPGRRSRSLRRALQSLALTDPDITRSRLEEHFLALV